MQTHLEWDKTKRGSREQQGFEKEEGAVLGLTSMGRSPGIKRVMPEEMGEDQECKLMQQN